MADHPILFKGDMVKAILDGCKTQTRRIIKPQPEDQDGYYFWWKGDWDTRGGPRAGVCTHGKPGNGEPTWTLEEIVEHSPYGVPGDLLWVRETWGLGTGGPGESPNIQYRGTAPWCLPCPKERLSEWGLLWAKHNAKWRPSIYMPKWACRLWLRVKSVRVERVQEITQADAIAEGATLDDHDNTCMGDCANRHCDKIDNKTLCDIYHTEEDCPETEAFGMLWDSINKDRGFGWDANPFCWVVDFERTEQ